MGETEGADARTEAVQRLTDGLGVNAVVVNDSLDWTDSGPVQRMVTEERALAAEAEVARLNETLERVKFLAWGTQSICDCDSEKGRFGEHSLTCPISVLRAALKEEATDGR